MKIQEWINQEIYRLRQKDSIKARVAINELIRLTWHIELVGPDMTTPQLLAYFNERRAELKEQVGLPETVMCFDGE